MCAWDFWGRRRWKCWVNLHGACIGIHSTHDCSLPCPQVVPGSRPLLLPPKPLGCRRKTLVLDLDETLVHSCLEPVNDADFTFPVHFNGQEHVIHVRQRPHLADFMRRVAAMYEVVVFTASQKVCQHLRLLHAAFTPVVLRAIRMPCVPPPPWRRQFEACKPA